MPLSPKKLAAQSETHSNRRSRRPSQDAHEGRKGNVLGQFESWLTNREEGISALTLRGYLADLGKFAERFHLSTSERFAPVAEYRPPSIWNWARLGEHDRQVNEIVGQ